MATALSKAIEGIDQLDEIGTILHLGAGDGADLADLSRTSARRIVLVEPAPAFHPALEAASDGARIRFLPVALGAKAGRAPLTQFNFAALSSLRDPTDALKDLFPGLRATATDDVDVLPLSAILEHMGPDDSLSNVLIAEAPGAAYDIVQALCKQEAPGPFAHVILRAGAGPIYKATPALEEMVARLKKHGYRVTRQDDSDPDFPCLTLRTEPLVIEMRNLQEKLDEATSRNEQLKARCNAAETTAAERADQLEALEKDLGERIEERDTHAARIRTLEERASSLDAERNMFEKTGTEQAERLRDAEDLTTEMRGQIESLRDDLVRERDLRARLESEVIRAQAQMELLREFMELTPERPEARKGEPPPKDISRNA